MSAHSHASGTSCSTSGCGCGCGCGHSHGGASPWRPILFSALLLAIGLAADCCRLWGPGHVARPLFYLVAYLPVALPVWRGMWAALRRGEWFSEFLLMAVASACAYALRDYPEAVAVVFLYQIGETLQEGAVDRAKGNIRRLGGLRPTAIQVETEAGLRTKSAAEVRPGDIVCVPAGGRVPVDGVLLDSASEFGTAALTGEPLPRLVAAGGEVEAGMTVVSRPVRLRTLRSEEESALGRIARLVEEAAGRKAPAERFIRSFARVYTPVVVLAAALLFLTATALGGDWTVWAHRSLTFLVVSCPCALVISVPLAYFRGIGVAASRGILFKGSGFVDTLAVVDAFVFDKTGTLTEGVPVCTGFEVTATTLGAAEVLQMALSVEQRSAHPLARAIAAYATAQGVRPLPATDVCEEAGRGISGTVDGRRVVLQAASSAPGACEAAATAIACCVDGREAGVFRVEDTLRAEAASALSELRAAGIAELAILSGDTTENVARLARQLGITAYEGGLLPAEKLYRLDRLRRRYPKVAYVGDGINDTPVLAAADVGFAIGTGSDTALETADVVVQGNELHRLADALRIARRTRVVARLNIALALAVKAVVLVLGALGLAGMWAAILADTGVALLCVAVTFGVRPPQTRRQPHPAA